MSSLPVPPMKENPGHAKALSSKVISGIVYPEKYEVRLGEEAEKLAREVVGRVKKEVRKRLPKKKAKGRKK